MAPIGHGSGPIPSRIMICGEAWGADEERAGIPFVGASGQELNRMLHESGILRSECYVSNVVNARPPNNDIGAWVALKKKDITQQHVPLRDKFVLPIVKQGYEMLLAEISVVQPNCIIAFGNLAMWALTGNWGVTKWRGSTLLHKESGAKVLVTIHPAAVLREWSWRAVVVNDLRRAARQLQNRDMPSVAWKLQVAPSFPQVKEILLFLLATLDAGVSLWIDLDLETRVGHIACCGISWSSEDALCIPFITRTNKEGYWSLEEETWIVWMLRKILVHKNVKVRAQNGLYDAQYVFRHWGFVFRHVQDTMISQHAIFSDMPKSLAFQASMYSGDHYQFWKEDK